MVWWTPWTESVSDGGSVARNLGHTGYRVGIFSPRSMWPFQYRHGASISPELQKAMQAQDGGIHHSPGVGRLVADIVSGREPFEKAN